MDTTPSKSPMDRSRKALKGRTVTAGSTDKKKSLDSSPVFQIIDLSKSQDAKKARQTRARCSSIDPSAQPDLLSKSKGMFYAILIYR